MFNALSNKLKEFFGKSENHIPVLLSEIAYYCQEMRQDDQYSYTVNDFSTHLTHNHGLGSKPMLMVIHDQSKEVVCFIENESNGYFEINNLKLMDSLKFIDSFNLIKKHYKLRNNSITFKDGKISKVVVVFDLSVGSIINKKTYSGTSIVSLVFDRDFKLTAVYTSQHDVLYGDVVDNVLFTPMSVEDELLVIFMKIKMFTETGREMFPEWCIPSAYDFSNPSLNERFILLEMIDY